MSIFKRKYIILIVGITLISSVQQQTETKLKIKKRPDSKKRIVSFSAKELEYHKKGDKGIHKLKGKVIFKKEDITIHADEALYEKQKQIEATGNVIIQKNDGGSVLMTNVLKYDVDKELAEFLDGVTLIEGDDTLTSDRGEYNDGDDIAVFTGNVKVKNKDQEFTCNTLVYDNLTEKHIKDHKKFLEGISINPEKAQKLYIAQGDIEITSLKDRTFIKGNNSIHYKEDDRIKIFGNPILRREINKDNFYLYGEELLIFRDEKSEKKSDKKLIVTGNARIYNKEIQAKSNTLQFYPSESILYFETNPIFWNEDNQITADYAKLTLKEDTVEEMKLESNVMLIQKTKQNNYNQIVGNDMIVSFDDNKVNNIIVEGDAQSIQFLDDEKKNNPKLIGVNLIKCDKIKIKVKDEKPSKILFLGTKSSENNVGGILFSPRKITPENNKLKNFEWRIYERPTYEEVDILLNHRSVI